MTDRRNYDPADALAAMTGGTGDAGAADERGGGADAGGGVEDLLAAPAPDASIFAPKRSTRDLVLEGRIRTRRTMIPILLTCGVLMPLVGSLKWLTSSDSPFAAWPIWPPIALTACGVALLTLAAANMAQVRQMMRRGRGK